MIPVAANPFPIIFAHRGGGHEAPENTMAAFALAQENGVTHIETDSHLTADGEVVLCHDDTIDRTYNGSGKIAELTYNQLKEFRNAAGETIPLLREVFERFPTLNFNIDAKEASVTDPLLDVIESCGAASRTLVGSFNEKRLRHVRERAIPSLSTSLGVSAIVRLMVASQTASTTDDWKVQGPSELVRAAQVPDQTRGIRVTTPRLIATAHNGGLAVHVWTINDPATMVRLLDWGVDGIMTDRPTMLREIMKARGQWRPQPRAK